MNCKAGDLACVVRMADSDSSMEAALRDQLVGRFVRCVSISPVRSDMWIIQEPVAIQLPIGWLPRETMVTAIADEFLQPVRGLPVTEGTTDEATA